MPPSAASPDSSHSGIGAGIVAAIPARWASTRLPGKPLLEIAGRPMIEHVYRRAQNADGIGRVVVLTDDERIRAAVEQFGGAAEMTPEDCRSGTDRIAHAARQWRASGADVVAVVNVQGDEPLIDPAAISAIARHLAAHPEDPLVTLAAPARPEELDDPNAVKVVVDRRGYALYFSRSRIPHPRHPESAAARKHVGIYGYQLAALLELADLAPTPLEQTESLEQLRALENGIRIRVLEVAGAAPGVDTRADLERAAARLAASDNSPTTPPITPDREHD